MNSCLCVCGGMWVCVYSCGDTHSPVCCCVCVSMCMFALCVAMQASVWWVAKCVWQWEKGGIWNCSNKGGHLWPHILENTGWIKSYTHSKSCLTNSKSLTDSMRQHEVATKKHLHEQDGTSGCNTEELCYYWERDVMQGAGVPGVSKKNKSDMWN